LLKITRLIGFTLIECLLSLLISTLIVASIIFIFLSAEKAMQSETDLAALQENERFVTLFLQNEINQAGNIGCGKLTDHFPLQGFLSYTVTPENKITWTESMLTVRHADAILTNLTRNMQGFSTFFVALSPRFAKGDIVIISNCASADIFQIKKISVTQTEQMITTEKPLSARYQKNDEVALFDTNTFFIDKTNRVTRDGKIIFALYQSDIYGRRTELSENVTNFVITNDQDESGKTVGLDLAADFAAGNFSKKWYLYHAL